MAGRPTGAVVKQFQVLFDHGAIGALSDGQLLQRFIEQRDEAAEVAFAALVARHGPMVLRLCRQVIGDEHEAQDAAQTVFIILARRAGSIQRHDSMASWLYRVARRIATRARVAAARRREVEWQGCLVAAQHGDDAGQTCPQPELYEELDRLPERYRAPLVLCLLEGLTHDEAARRLRCPVRTVETRLLRGRARLRERLVRRGLVPSAVLAAATLGATAALPAAWTTRTIRAVIAFTTGHLAAVGIASAPALVLAEGVLNTMFLKKLGMVATSVVILGGFVVAGGLWARPEAARTSPAPLPPSALPAAVPPKSNPPEREPLHPDLFVVQAKAERPDDGPRELALDDGKMKGKRSIAGGGHAVRFDAPAEGWMLTAVRVHGSRYGYPRPPKEDFKVFVCDDRMKLIAEFAFPYSKFGRGESKWVTLDIKPTELPKTFMLGVDFDPTQTKGVYVSHDSEGSGRSVVGLPGDESQPFKQGDWLIRAKIAPAKKKGATAG